MEELDVHTEAREEFVDISAQVRRFSAAHSESSAVLVFCPHTTAGVTINENADPDVVTDVLEGLRRVVPRDGGYRHAEGNSDGHTKASLVGSSAIVPVRNGVPLLGTWQGVYLCEFDGPRTRRVVLRALA